MFFFTICYIIFSQLSGTSELLQLNNFESIKFKHNNPVHGPAVVAWFVEGSVFNSVNSALYSERWIDPRLEQMVPWLLCFLDQQMGAPHQGLFTHQNIHVAFIITHHNGPAMIRMFKKTVHAN